MTMTDARRTPLSLAGGLLLALAAAAPARAQAPAGEPPAGEEIPSPNADVDGYVPEAEPAAFGLAGYVDVGFADAQGDGTSFHPLDARLPADYGVDTFATAVNSRGDVASSDAGGRFTNGFLPRSAGIGGRPSFLLNTFSLELRQGAPSAPVLVFARALFLPRLGDRGSETRVLLEQAFGRLQPLSSAELFLFAGKLDSVFGIEYLENQANLRTGITPSLLARYTTGPSIGAKLFYRVQLAPLWSAFSVNLAATNSAPFVEALQPTEVSLTGRPVLTGRAGYELNLPQLQLKAGGSGLVGPRNDQGDRDARQRGWGLDARLTAAFANLSGEYVHIDQDQGPAADKLTGAGAAFIASGFHVRGLWGQLAIGLPVAAGPLRRAVVYARGEQRRAWFTGFTHLTVRRLTVGARLDLWDTLAVKGEWLLNREVKGAPEVDNDVRAASLVWSY
jgi:hypothetical protein